MNRYRIVYGTSEPIWTHDFPAWSSAADFIKRCLDRGDQVFEVIDLRAAECARLTGRSAGSDLVMGR